MKQSYKFIRINPKDHKKIERIAKEEQLSIKDTITLLLKTYKGKE